MAKQSEHIKQAERNEGLAETLVRTTFHEWTVTLFFYAALQYVDSILVISGEKISSHSERETLMWKNVTTKKIYKEYRSLSVFSRNGRYHLAPVSAQETHAASEHFSVIRAHLRKCLGLR